MWQRKEAFSFCAFVLVVTCAGRLLAGDPIGDDRIDWTFLDATDEVYETTAYEYENLSTALNLQPRVPAAELLRPPSPPRAPRRPAPVRRPAAKAAAFGLASVPFMIGDTGGGGCATVSFLGVQEADIEHPTLACSRVNISHSNSPMLQDRVYFSYRHYQNATETKVFEFENDLNIDLFTLGAERTFFGGLCSLEIRVPGSYELNSDLTLDIQPTTTNLPISDMNGEFGNISVIFKALLHQRRRFLLSGGLGVKIPTADDVTVHGDLNSNFLVLEDTTPQLFAFTDAEFDILVRNNTVEISPFLAWMWMPNDRFFHHGFFQVDVAANPSPASLTGGGDIWSFTLTPPAPVEHIPLAIDEAGLLHLQTLMRLNLGFGYWFYKNPRARCLNALAGMLELHYTSTLQDAKILERNLWNYHFQGVTYPVDLGVGNQLNRTDIVNLTIGAVAQIGKTEILNGFIIPLDERPEKPFDFEYNLQIQRRF